MKHLSAPSQLVLRHQQRFDNTPLLLVNAPDAEVADALNVVQCWHLHAGYAKQWRAHAPQVMHHFGADAPVYDAAQAPRAALVWLPKEKQLTWYLLDALRSVLAVGAEIWLVGENRGGIKSIHKQFPASVTPAQKMAVGNHSLLLRTEILATLDAFNVHERFEYVDLPQPGQPTPLKLASLPGVFAFPGIDAGSAMLLEHLPAWQQGQVLDFACGHGVLGAWLQRQAQQLQVTYLDVSALALAATAQTLKQNGLTGECIASNGLTANLPQFDYVVSHPPFHTGLATDYEIGKQFLQQIRQHLRPNGELWLVANRFLPWPELIEQAFGHCERVAQDNKFAVYVAGRQARKR
ncbi:MAG: class I SAM-dependent methyltransferase [Gammaproteobacteria bacterium]|jgi:16S rRNA (guanine1207-N2)-methyltransferase|nr:class I SAM-dependent methyltransferase [Gammaproteobacteria bacterium]